MNILLTGGTGFIGAALCRALSSDAHSLTVLSRKPATVALRCGENVKAVERLDAFGTDKHFDAIINLAGEGIADARWSDSRKKLLRDSRIGVTAELIRYIDRVEKKPKVLISGSAVGYYGDQGDKALDEQTPGHDEFSHRLCAEWEQTARQAENYGVRVCIIRTGLVIAAGGGFLQRLLPPFKLGMGGRLGSGKQWMSWIHRDDYIAIVKWLLAKPEWQGVFNGTAPHPVTNAEFTCSLAKLLRRPALLPVPAIALKLLLGEMADLLLGGQRALPVRLQQAGFTFQYPELQDALCEALGVRHG
ncbi:MAG: TIGR01777 family oxidoreductase [Gammaproteobacteria bacterium]